MSAFATVITHADDSCVSIAMSGVCVIPWFCLSVRLSVCPHDKTKTAESTITKVGIRIILIIIIVHHDTSQNSEY